MRTLLITCCFLPLILAAQNSGQNYWQTGYYGVVGSGAQTPSLIPWSKYTNVNHFSASPAPDCTIDTTLVGRQIADFVGAAHDNGSRALISILDGLPGVYLNCTNADNVYTFVNNIVNFVTVHDYDGVDLDWEQVPNSYLSYITQYNDLITRLRDAMPGKIITMAAYWNSPGHAIELVASTSQSKLDRVNIMCYDMDVNGKTYTWFVDALWQAGETDKDACDAQVFSFLSRGLARNKINIGFPFYGRIFPNVIGPGVVRPPLSTTTVHYRNLVNDKVRWQDNYKRYDVKHGATYLSIPLLNEFVTYGGEEMIEKLIDWVKTQDFGGIMTFSVPHEFLSDQTGDARYPLSTLIHKGLFGDNAPVDTSDPNQPVADRSRRKHPGGKSSVLKGVAAGAKQR
jgi:hypothetical protein